MVELSVILDLVTISRVITGFFYYSLNARAERERRQIELFQDLMDARA